MINLDGKWLDLIKEILKKHVPNCEVRAFGSRANGQAKQHSDLDLVIIGKEKLDWKHLESLKSAFSESNLPIMVDVIDWHTIPESFQNFINKKYDVIQDTYRTASS